MQLEFAMAAACEPSRCRVVPIDGHDPIDANYGSQVLNRIKVRPGDLVAIDLAEEPPTVVWRWWHGTVRGLNADGATIERAVTKRAANDTGTATLRATLPDALRGQVAAGDTVFFGHGGAESAIVIDVAAPSGPAHPARLRSELLPGVVAAYEAMGH